VIGPPDQTILRTAAQVQLEWSERPVGYFSSSNPGPVLEPEHGRDGRQLGIEGSGGLLGVNGAGGLTHDGAPVEVPGIAKEGGAGLGKTVDDRPVDRSRARKSRKQAAMEAVDPERERIEK
jgi:hypothetical protein